MMSSAWKSFTRGYKTPPSETASAFGLKDEENIRRLTDTFVVNDLKEEYYYSQSDVVIDAFQNHLKIVDKDPELYKEIIKTLRPVMLDCQKTIAALYLWDRNIDRDLALELLKDVRPTWKITFFYMLKKPFPFMNLLHKGWGRAARRFAIQTLLEGLTPFYAMKYRRKLKNIARWAHIKPETAALIYLFEKWKKDPELLKVIEAEPFFKDYLRVKEAIREGLTDLKALYQTDLPFTVLKGMLGNKINDPKVFKAIMHTMTIWEIILSLRQIENRGLMNDPEVQELILRRLKLETLKSMRIDIVELLQAYRKVQHPFSKQILEQAISSQVSALTESLMKYLKDKKVAVVFDTSGSMEHVLDWSLSLSLVCAMVNPKDTRIIAFADEAVTLPIPTEKKLMLDLYRKMVPQGGTALGKALIEALKHSPDIIIFISDFEGNIEPWSDQVYKEYVKAYGKFPQVVSIKFTTSPSTAYGEITALRTGRWLGIPNEHKIVMRNLWDLPTMLEYIFNLLPLLKKRKKEIIEYVA